ncbi:hypothetical protein BDW42DRAFT_187178 [Aspergillus taichungensis]|uniref:Uncharacterized protein n=1 Tax=Aspergillus taichungensis TaxID=482145 RepID=A0A2J5HNJ3_9EURO|nr:hypothetical protein BDW42DRAFT_187178 [Aspergillus taichungensis]
MSGSVSRVALDKQQIALRVEELTSLLERVSPEETEVITRIHQIVETLQDDDRIIEQSLRHKLLLAVEGNRHNVIHTLGTNPLHYIACLLIDADTGDCQTRGLYLLLVWLCSRDGYSVAQRHNSEESLPAIEACSLQRRGQLFDRLSGIFHDGQRDNHRRKLAGKILVDMLLRWKGLNQIYLKPLWIKIDSVPDNTVLGFFAGLITHILLSMTVSGESASTWVCTVPESPFYTYLEQTRSDPPKFLADMSAMMGQSSIIYTREQSSIPRTRVTTYFLRSISIDMKSLANNIVLATLSPTELTIIYTPADECNGYFEYIEVSFSNPRCIHTSLHTDGAKGQQLVLYIDDADLVSRNGQKQRGDKMIIRMGSSDDLSELKERMRSILAEDNQANRTGSVSRRSSSMFITLDSTEDITRKSLTHESAHDESPIINQVQGPEGAITGALLDNNEESHSYRETSHQDDVGITQENLPNCNMSQGQEQNDEGGNVMTRSPAQKSPVTIELLEGVCDCSNEGQFKSPSVELGLGLETGEHMKEPGKHPSQSTGPQKSKSPLKAIRVESPDRNGEYSHGLHFGRDSKRLLPNTQESLIFPLRRAKRKVYNLNSRAAVDWDEDLRPSDEANENVPPPKRLSRVGFTSVTSLISSPFPGDELIFQPKPKEPSLANRKEACTRKARSKRKMKEELTPKPCLPLDIASQTIQQPHDDRHGDTEMTNDNGLCLTDGDEQHQFSVLDGFPNLGIEVAAVFAETDTTLVDAADTSNSMLCNGDGDPVGSTPDKIHFTDINLGQSDDEPASKVGNELNQNTSQDFEQRKSLNEGRGLAMGKRLAAALRGCAATSHEAGYHDASSVDTDTNGKIDNNGSLETVSSVHSATAQDVDIKTTAEKDNVDRVDRICVTDSQMTNGIATPTLVSPEEPGLQYTQEVLHGPTVGSSTSDSEALNEKSKAKLQYSISVDSDPIGGVDHQESSSHAHSRCQTYQRPLNLVPELRRDDRTKCDILEEEKRLTATISPRERMPTVNTDTLPDIFHAHSQAQFKHPRRPSEILRTTIVDRNGSPRLFSQTEHGHQSRKRYSLPRKGPTSPIGKYSSSAHPTSSDIVSQTGSFDDDLIRAFVISREKLGIHSNKDAREKCATSRESTVAISGYTTDYSSVEDSSFNTVDCTVVGCLGDSHGQTPPVLVSETDAELTQQSDRDTVAQVDKSSPGREPPVQLQPGQHPIEGNNSTDHPVLLQTVRAKTRNEFSASNTVGPADHKEYLLCQLEQERKTITEALETYRRQCHRVLDQLFEAQKEQIRVCREQMEGVQRRHADICREFTDRLEANASRLPTSSEWELFQRDSERPSKPSPR